MRLATIASVAVAGVLIAVKVVAWAITDSVSLLSSLVDSLLDAGASTVNLLAVRHALTPPDREHRFGHGKVESLAGLAQAAFIAGSAVFLIMEAGQRFVTPRPVAHVDLGIAVMVFSMLLTLALVAFQRHVVRATNSVAIRADELHYRGDILLNGSVIVSLAASLWLGWTWIDPLFALAIAGYILLSAWSIAALALDVLMDRELPDADRARIRAIALEHPEVTNLHDLRSRSAGTATFIQLHLEMDGSLPLQRAHEISDAVEQRIMEAFPGAEVIIHEDPAGVETEPRKLALRR
jgi:ferrous-iron efflux pump FieF